MKELLNGISIIMPLYNAEKYIENTITNLLNIKGTDIEMILVDDGSTDETLNILNKKIEILNKREIYVYQKEHEGVSQARNFGIRKAKYNHILFFDDDDKYDENICTFFIQEIKNTDSDLIATNIEKINISSNSITKKINKNVVMNKNEAIEKMLTNDKNYEFSSVAGKLFKTELCRDTLFEAGRRSNEDRFFVFSYILKCKKIIWLTENVYTYVMRENSSSTSKINERLFDNIYFSESIINNINIKCPDMIDYAYYNDFHTSLWVYRNFYRYNVYKTYKEELKKIKKKLLFYIRKKVTCENKERIEIFILVYFNYFYRLFIKIYDWVSKYER